MRLLEQIIQTVNGQRSLCPWVTLDFIPTYLVPTYLLTYLFENYFAIATVFLKNLLFIETHHECEM